MKKHNMIIALLFIAALFVTAARAAQPYASAEKEAQFAQVTTGEAISAGNMVAVWTNGLAYLADDTANYKVIGRAESTVASGKTLLVKKGIFRWANQGSFTDADINDVCYVWTNGHYSVTTAAIASNDVKAGVIVDVDSLGVWVNMGAEPLVTATPSTLAVAGNATVGGTLAVTGTSALTGNTAVTGNTTVGGTLGVTGATTLAAVTASGASTLAALTVNGAATFTNAVFKITAIPTSTNGLAVGTLWSDSGTIKIIAE